METCVLLISLIARTRFSSSAAAYFVAASFLPIFSAIVSFMAAVLSLSNLIYSLLPLILLAFAHLMSRFTSPMLSRHGSPIHMQPNQRFRTLVQWASFSMSTQKTILQKPVSNRCIK
ncbi:hypothetical protein BJ741DRAFT_630223 [Chytriomyces cf. hyalinus JEL632]|nr:hypothetical protein BJ741DRAFT_630223 [Chytriomyces cf. hyalinus JEL632]